MKLEGYRLVFVVVGLIGVLLIASPEIAGAIPRLPAESQFSELYLLGPNQMAANYGVCFCAAAMNNASYTVMFWVTAMCIASSFNSLVGVIVNPSYSFVISSSAKLASSGLRSLSKFVCFQMTFRH